MKSYRHQLGQFCSSCCHHIHVGWNSTCFRFLGFSWGRVRAATCFSLSHLRVFPTCRCHQDHQAWLAGKCMEMCCFDLATGQIFYDFLIPTTPTSPSVGAARPVSARWPWLLCRPAAGWPLVRVGLQQWSLEYLQDHDGWSHINHDNQSFHWA